MLQPALQVTTPASKHSFVLHLITQTLIPPCCTQYEHQSRLFNILLPSLQQLIERRSVKTEMPATPLWLTWITVSWLSYGCECPTGFLLSLPQSPRAKMIVGPSKMK